MNTLILFTLFWACGNTKQKNKAIVSSESREQKITVKSKNNQKGSQSKWSEETSSFEEIQQRFSISIQEDDIGNIFWGDTKLEYETFSFRKYHNNKETLFLITGQGIIGTPNTSLFHHLFSEKGTRILFFQSIRPLQLLPKPDLSLSLGYSEGTESVVTYRNNIATESKHKPGLTVIPMHETECQSMYEITHEQCSEPKVAADCSEIDGYYAISMDYADAFMSAESSSTFQYQKQPEYCLQVCQKEKKMSFSTYKKEICGI